MIISQQTLFAEPTMIERLIMQGSNFVGGKERITNLYKKELTKSERVDAIRQEYGTRGGGSFIKGYLWEYDSRGIRVKETTEWNIVENLTWHEVEEVIGRLIAEDRYL